MKKSLLWLLIMLLTVSMVVTFSLAGCKKEEVAEEEAVEEEVAEEEVVEEEAVEEEVAEASGEVLYWSYEPNDQKYVDLFNQTHPNIQVKHVSMGPWDLEDKLLTAIASGKGAPDVTMVIARRFQRFAMGTGMLDITDYVGDKRNDFMTEAFNMGTYKDRVFAITGRVCPVVMHYRYDLFEEYGLELPKTFQDLSKIQEKLPEGVYTLPIFYPGAHWGAEWFRGLLQLNGGGIFDENGKFIQNNTTAVEVLTWIKNLVDSGIGYPVKWFEPEMYTEVKDGKVVMWITNIAELANFKAMYPDMAGQWSCAPIPLWDEGSAALTFTWGNEAFAIPAQAKNPDAAYVFIDWLNTSSDALDLVSSDGFVPGYKPYLETSEKLKQPDEYLAGGVVLNDVVMSREIAPFNFIDWIYTSKILGEALDAMFGGEKTPEEAWAYVEQRAAEEMLGTQ